MELRKFISHPLVIYLLKFVAAFCILYYGTLAIEGLATPANHYSPFVERWLDYPSWVRASLLWGTKTFLALLGYTTIITDAYHLQMYQGNSVQLIYACLGVGVTSFWVASAPLCSIPLGHITTFIFFLFVANKGMITKRKENIPFK